MKASALTGVAVSAFVSAFVLASGLGHAGAASAQTAEPIASQTVSAEGNTAVETAWPFALDATWVAGESHAMAVDGRFETRYEVLQAGETKSVETHRIVVALQGRLHIDETDGDGRFVKGRLTIERLEATQNLATLPPVPVGAEFSLRKPEPREGGVIVAAPPRSAMRTWWPAYRAFFTSLLDIDVNPLAWSDVCPLPADQALSVGQTWPADETLLRKRLTASDLSLSEADGAVEGQAQWLQTATIHGEPHALVRLTTRLKDVQPQRVAEEDSLTLVGSTLAVTREWVLPLGAEKAHALPLQTELTMTNDADYRTADGVQTKRTATFSRTVQWDAPLQGSE